LQGAFTGTLITPVNGSDIEVRAHLGVPFAQAPVGALRFAAPKPITGYLGERNATVQTPSCYQPLDPGSFDVFYPTGFSEGALLSFFPSLLSSSNHLI
jgi:carboxylesterase type B